MDHRPDHKHKTMKFIEESIEKNFKTLIQVNTSYR